jgi:uncharacterized protein (TIGR02246 family)
MSRPPPPPFSEESAIQKIRAAEDAWNTRDPARVALAYTADSRWRSRAEFPRGREEIETFLTRKWTQELDYRFGPLPATASRSALPTSTATIAANGSEPMAMRTGSSMPMA